MEKTFTLLWRDGTATLAHGATFDEARKAFGLRYGNRGLDFYVEGDVRDFYVWNKKAHRWDREPE